MKTKAKIRNPAESQGVKDASKIRQASTRSPRGTPCTSQWGSLTTNETKKQDIQSLTVITAKRQIKQREGSPLQVLYAV